MKKNFLTLICLFVMFDFYYCGNSTDCYLLYTNKSITTPCVTNNTCCYMKITFKAHEQVRCVVKQQENENNCNNYKGTVSNYGGEVLECKCNGYFIVNNIYTIYILFIVVILSI